MRRKDRSQSVNMQGRVHTQRDPDYQGRPGAKPWESGREAKTAQDTAARQPKPKEPAKGKAKPLTDEEVAAREGQAKQAVKDQRKRQRQVQAERIKQERAASSEGQMQRVDSDPLARSRGKLGRKWGR
jgi:hypothetical protein